MDKIIKFLDDYLSKSNIESIGAVEANELLAKMGILKDSEDRPGKPLRDLLRKGSLPHAFQIGGKGSSWKIPHSSVRINNDSNFSSAKRQEKNISPKQTQENSNKTINISTLKKQLEKARKNYKPEKVKYLLIAEAPPDSLERFLYYENVSQHDYLFLGIAEALYPELKKLFIEGGRKPETKKLILQRLQDEGFYLLDLSELPISILENNLSLQLPNLIEKIKSVINDDTRIILIKANVYDSAFNVLNRKFKNVIDQRIAFPGQGWQPKFQIEFKRALKIANYFN